MLSLRVNEIRVRDITCTKAPSMRLMFQYGLSQPLNPLIPDRFITTGISVCLQSGLMVILIIRPKTKGVFQVTWSKESRYVGRGFV